MSDEDFDRLVMASSLYRQYCAERESISRHQKRIENEQHHPITFETALVDWMLKCRQNWRREHPQQ
jgi:hypothetical protein